MFVPALTGSLFETNWWYRVKKHSGGKCKKITFLMADVTVAEIKYFCCRSLHADFSEIALPHVLIV